MRLHHVLTLVALLGLPAVALAQGDRGATVAGTVSATVFDSETDLSFSGAFGYRFGRVVGLELEATLVPELSSPYRGTDDYVILTSFFPAIYPPPRFENTGGRMVIFSNNVRIAVPTTSRRLEPYFVAGGGIASVRRTADYVYPLFDPRLLANPDLFTVPGVVLPPPRSSGTFRQPFTTSAVEMALTIGGGLSVRVLSQMAVDIDLRMFTLLGDEDRNMGRFGVGVRYRF